MCAMMAFINAIIAVSPLALVAIVTLPVACICERFAYVAEYTGFHSLLRIVFAHQDMRWNG